MKPVIGIIGRYDKSRANRDINIVYSDIVSAILCSGGIPIGVFNIDFNRYLDICDGFILQGGNDIDNYNLNIIKILQKKNIPLLGICLGMQEMGLVNGGTIRNISNHKDIKHDVMLGKDSLLYKIIEDDKICVNSRHKSAITNVNIMVSSKSDDNVIEAIENSNLNFFLGIQWHPENMYNEDVNSRKIFDYFVKMCNDVSVRGR